MSDKLFFYSKSANVCPGKGAHEEVADKLKYAPLSKIENWRRVLSNFHMCPFKYNGFTYNTIEHVFQSEKIRLVDTDAAFTFTVESGTELGLGDGAKAQSKRKLVKLTGDQLKMWASLRKSVMRDAAIAKYAVCDEAKKVLKLTMDAELWHIVPRSRDGPDRFVHLEEIRKGMRDD
jgi:predicted NAD-dependent protein-ADP-ribosyltransferase YbiA (DUF1768 family)